MATQYEYTPSSDNLVTYRQPSDNSNGNFLDNDGKTLLTCEHANRVLSKTDLTSGERTVIASEFGGSPLTSPNDGSPQRSPTAFLRWQGLRLFWAVIVSRRTGHIYFTDRKCTVCSSLSGFFREAEKLLHSRLRDDGGAGPRQAFGAGGAPRLPRRRGLWRTVPHRRFLRQAERAVLQPAREPDVSRNGAPHRGAQC